MRKDIWKTVAVHALAASLAAALVSPAFAFSEIKKEDAPASTAQPQTTAPGETTQPAPSSDNDTAPPANTVPSPPAVQSAPGADQGTGTDQGTGGQSAPQQIQQQDESTAPDVTRPHLDPNAPLPEVLYDLDKLPPPVRKMHDALREACKSGDIQKLRPLLSTGDEPTQLSLGEVDGDPIDFLHQLAGDEGGQEILAIMEEILDAGYVHLDAGKPTELYVWPYFFALPLDKLTAPQRVELYRIITAGDYEDMKSVGAYIFYRLGITPDGKWAFFLAGD